MPSVWKSECLLVWNVTCPDTLAASYRTRATSMSRKVAEAAEEGKSAQYQGLPPGHCFTLVAIKFGSNWSKVTGLLIIIIIIVKSLGY